VPFIREYLQAHNIAVVTTREPGGTPLAEDIRRVLLTERSEPVDTNTELLLMFAARAQHVAEVIQPGLAAGKWILSDRFVDATYAYQGGGRNIALSRIEALETWVLQGFKPRLTFLFDAPVEVALSRAKSRNTPDRFEREQAEFFERVREVYLQRAAADPNRFVVIDASVALADVQAAITRCLDQFLQNYYHD
jgi:dTMP kinase